MSEYHYLLLGGSRHGQKHVDQCHQFSLYFWADKRLQTQPGQLTAEMNGVKNERYKVCPEKGADGNWYLVGYCGACPDIPLEDLTNLIRQKNVKPLMCNEDVF